VYEVRSFLILKIIFPRMSVLTSMMLPPVMPKHVNSPQRQNFESREFENELKSHLN
jgi:hypothetical protein